ncbi:E3 ubiquitin/ISG15 ligase TRIM25-like [Hyperolius riggenbachi]|uniref:E3 ubiquitin/ISG15 ligase TRIM25-like n=1 Tax=Hyperolius riggenbachi TaxID=752182 RepID=UPI0035A32C6C
MASADLSEELECPVCLTIYTDHVMLRCGHNFCRVCIDHVLDSQEGSAGYSCPKCREEYKERPGLHRNIALRNIAERFLTTQPDQEEAGVHCTYCVDSPVPAVMSCLLCDASMCDNHLRVHSKAPEHVLCAPTTSPETRKCSVHKKILEYYCTEDASCVCVTCTLAGEHRGHQVETLQEASEKKKKKLRNDLQTLMAETEEAEKRVQSLEEHRRKAQEKAAGETEKVTALFRDLRRRLEELEKRVLSDITRRVQYYDDIIRQLEIKKAELSRKMRHIEELCNMTDPLTVLQESDTGDLCDTEDRHDKQLHDGGDLDVAGISHTLHTGLADIMSGVIVQKHTDTQAMPPLSRPCPQPSPTGQHTQAYPHSSTEDKVPITAKLSRPRPQNQRLSLWFPVLLPAMASADRSEELECPLCLTIYTDPVMLRCGHNFCRVCIERVLDSQEGSAGYSCPECREEYKERPGLHRNIALRNIAERFLTTPDQEEAGVHCTYCIHSPVPAVMSCLLCDASMCDNHLRVHSKAPEHVLCAPTTSPETRKCSVHKKILEYYCTEDASCVCVSCRLDGEHRGHQVETLQEATEKKKKKLRDDLQTLMAETEEAEKRVQSLEERRRKAQEKAAGETERVTALFRDLRRRLEELEKRVLSDIMRQAEMMSQSYDDIIRQLEIKKAELSRKMRHIEELSPTAQHTQAYPHSSTEDKVPITAKLSRPRLHPTAQHTQRQAGGTHIEAAQQTSGLPVYADILLDVTTAANDLHISDDRKTASRSHIRQNRPDTAERFQDHPQVLSSQSFSSGRHYWEVDVGRSDNWIVGMCYPSMARRGEQSLIGENNKSWGVCRERWFNRYSVRHDSKEIRLPGGIRSDRVRIDLDYEAGQISFYALCDPIRHLHTFTATFTEPLHAGLGVDWYGYIAICGGSQGV